MIFFIQSQKMQHLDGKILQSIAYQMINTLRKKLLLEEYGDLLLETMKIQIGFTQISRTLRGTDLMVYLDC